MVKVAWGAGHGINTPGKRSPNDEREWSFNDKVVDAGMLHLAKYENVQQIRVDDSSGKVDAPLVARTNQVNYFKADLYVSCHHNAMAGSWGDHGGVETFTYDHPKANPKSVAIAKVIHSKVVKAMGLNDRGLKKANFHDLRESNMPSVLVEGGFMDSRIDIKKLRDDKALKAQGEAIAKGIAEYFKLELKEVVKPVSNPVEKPETVKGKLFKVQIGAFSDVKNASRLAKELKSKGYPATIIEA